MKTKLIILGLILALSGLAARADSPLTSTEFGKVYTDAPIVQMALDLEGELNTTLLNYLADEANPIDVRVAIINVIGWNFEGMSTGEQLRTYLMGRYKAKDEAALAKKLQAGTLITYAYAQAMSNYFTVDNALALADQAVAKNKQKSFTVNFIAELIRAQKCMDDDWGAVYTTVANVLYDGSLTLDMRQAAIDNVMDYINLYKEYAN